MAFQFSQEDHHCISDSDYDATHKRIWSKEDKGAVQFVSIRVQRVTIGLHANIPEAFVHSCWLLQNSSTSDFPTECHNPWNCYSRNRSSWIGWSMQHARCGSQGPWGIRVVRHIWLIVGATESTKTFRWIEIPKGNVYEYAQWPVHENTNVNDIFFPQKWFFKRVRVISHAYHIDIFYIKTTLSVKPKSIECIIT